MKYCLLICLVSLLSCNGDKPTSSNTLKVGTGNDVTVTLLVSDTKNIQEINFTSDKDSETITITEFETYNSFVYQFENKGEGTFEVCVITEKDTFCSESYVERGYSPELKFEKDSLIYISWF